MIAQCHEKLLAGNAGRSDDSNAFFRHVTDPLVSPYIGKRREIAPVTFLQSCALGPLTKGSHIEAADRLD